MATSIYDAQRSRPPPIEVEEICRRALAAHAHLYRLLACDEPDLAANVTYVVGRAKLRHLAEACLQPVAGASTEALLEFVEAAERVTDPLLAERLFPSFVDEVIARLEGRLARQLAPGRPLAPARPATRAWDDDTEPVEAAQRAPDRPIEGRAPVPR